MAVDTEKIWSGVLTKLKNDKTIQPSMFDGWISQICPISSEDGIFSVSLPSNLHADFVRKQLKDIILAALKEITQTDFLLDISVAKQKILSKETKTEKKAKKINTFDEFSIDNARSISNGLNLKYRRLAAIIRGMAILNHVKRVLVLAKKLTPIILNGAL